MKPRVAHARHMLGNAVLATVVAACATRAAHPAAESVPSPRTAGDASAPPRGASRATAAVDDYFGVSLVDSHRWLEDDEAGARAYEKEATDEARRWLDALPGYSDLHRRVEEALRATASVESVREGGATHFLLRRDADGRAPKLVALRAGAAERVLLDISAETEETGATIDFVRPSPSGRLAAVGVSHRGDESTTLRIVDVASGRLLSDAPPRVRLAEVEWLPDEHGFIYLRNQAVDGRSADRLKRARLVHHAIGAPVADDQEILLSDASHGDLCGELSTASVVARTGATHVLLLVRHRSVDPYVSVYRKRASADWWKSGPWELVAPIGDSVRDAVTSGKRTIVLREAPDGISELVRYDDEDAHRPPKILHRARSASNSITAMELLGSDVVVRWNDNGASRLSLVSVETGAVSDVPMPFVGTADLLSADRAGRALVFRDEGWLQPRTWLTLEAGATSPRVLVAPREGTATDVAIDELQVTARDGEQIPVTLLRSEGARPPYRMAWMSAYGAYGFSLSPTYKATRKEFFAAGGVVVFAHVRGGMEKGRRWHDGGRGLQKINTVNDTIDVAAALSQRGIVRPGGLGLAGVSAGGIPVGMAAVTRPELFGAVVLNIATTSVLRDEKKGTLGPMHEEEFGSSKTKEGFEALLRIDPYFNVRDGVRYPSMLIAGGMRDARVPHWHAAKMYARLREANASDRPILLRITDTGHGNGRVIDTAIDLETDILAFFLAELGGDSSRRP